VCRAILPSSRIRAPAGCPPLHQPACKDRTLLEDQE
jgi:hypothetical protein